jgi:thiol:disulfide interchange protein
MVNQKLFKKLKIIINLVLIINLVSISILTHCINPTEIPEPKKLIEINTPHINQELAVTISPNNNNNNNNNNNGLQDTQVLASTEILNQTDTEDSTISPVSQPETTKSKSWATSIWEFFHTLSNWIQDSLRSEHISQTARLVSVFFLGLLMSLTPCIYPVIPLTVGALQTQKSRSLGFSFLLSLTYAMGLSLTFAIMGFVAAISGQLFGSFASHPIFVLIVIAQLLYMAGSMFGWYEIYIPRFLQINNKNPKSGSLLSAFSFGVISGTVASPCLSPGLALLLTIVATLANKFLGFILLFIFGLGLSTPLVLIGTFSNAMNLLPRAGMWMVTVKKLFGWLLIGMSLYFLNNLIPFVPYFVKLVTPAQQSLPELPTQTDYQTAQKFAIDNQKLLLIDIGADWCTLCKKLDRRLFHNAQLIDVLSKNFVILKVNATDPQSEPYVTLNQKYNIIGVPTVLIIEPKTETLVARYNSNLLEKTDLEIQQTLQILN